jgi:hypothetical protein
MEPKRSIQIDDDPAFQRKGWAFERAGWLFLLLLLTSAMAGAFGSGALSSAEQQVDGLMLEYQRVLRYQAPASLEVRFRHGHGPVRLFVSRDWLDGATVERTSPAASAAVLTKDGMVLEFAADPALAGGHIRIDFRPDHMGWHDGAIALEGKEMLRFRALVLP